MPFVRADVRDWFAHWPVAADDLAARLPPALAPATRDGTARASGLFGAAGLPDPAAEPVCRYSAGTDVFLASRP